MTTYVYIAESLDGLIADSSGGLAWLQVVPNPDNSDYGFAEFLSGVDAIVMGRRTFETVAGFDDWPYSAPVIVLSESLSALPAAFEGRAEILRGDPRVIVASLEDRGYSNLYIDGGRTIQRFLDDDLIDEMIITRIPVLLGGGTPLFGSMSRPLSFIHHNTRALNSQLVQSRYVRDRRQSDTPREARTR